MDGFELFLFLVPAGNTLNLKRVRDQKTERKNERGKRKKFNYRIEGSNHFSLPRVTAAVIAFVFLKMKCHTLSHSAVNHESGAHIHTE